ncbi:MAG: hypothetical protein VKK62_00745 [Synechococcaceae cyanobacterium]|nr:hypothetical protein [Synechococcaceae cyanobacterium]
MTPLPDRVVITTLVLTVLICFALAAWAVRLAPPQDHPLIWRDSAPPARTAPPLPADAV